MWIFTLGGIKMLIVTTDQIPGKEIKEVRQTAEEKTCSSKETSGKGGKVIWQIKIQVQRKLICQL